MANWNLPTISSAYQDITPLLRDLAIDAAQMFSTDPTNAIDGMIKLVRSPVKLQERGSGTWNDRLLSVAGGGTGADNATTARVNLGLGTMATQDASTVAITGGTLAGNGSGLTSLNASSLTSGTVAAARLGSGSSINSKFLRGDNTWQAITVIAKITRVTGVVQTNGSAQDYSISPALTDYTKAGIMSYTGPGVGGSADSTAGVYIKDNSTLTIAVGTINNPTRFNCYILEANY